MKPITYKLRLDAYTNECQAKIHAKQFDTGTRNLSVVLVLDDGAPYDMEGVAGATLYAKRPDGLTTLAAAEIEAGEIKLTIPSSIFSAQGTAECELTLYDADSNQLTSPRFDVIVEDSLYDENAVTASNDFTALIQKISEVERLKNGLVIKDCYPTLADLEAAVTEALPGDTYGVGTEGSYDVYTWAESKEWVNMGPLDAELDNVFQLAHLTEIPAHADLDSYMTPGSFYCAGPNVSTLSHLPPLYSIAAPFMMWVSSAGGTTVRLLVQQVLGQNYIFINHGTGWETAYEPISTETLSLEAGWTANNSGRNEVSRVGKRCVLSISAKYQSAMSPTTATLIATLPAEYRPEVTTYGVMYGYHTSTPTLNRLNVHTDGTVDIQGTTAANTSMTGFVVYNTN